MKLQSKFSIFVMVAACFIWNGASMAQPNNGRGPESGMSGPGAMPGGPGRSGGPSASPFSSGSPNSGRSGPTFSPGPQMSGQGRSMSPQGPVQSTRFGSVPGSGSSAPSMGRGPGPAGPFSSPYGSGRSPADTSRMQQALRQGDYKAIEEESRGVRSRANDIQNMGPDLPVQDRIKLPLINQMYRQGADMVDDGRTKQDKSKINYGIQQINEANERLGHLKGSSDRHSSEGQGRQERSNGRR